LEKTLKFCHRLVYPICLRIMYAGNQ